MDVSTLQFDKRAIKEALETQPDHSIIAKKPLIVCFPKQFEHAGLAEVFDVVSCVGMVGIVCEGKYCCLGVLGRFNFTAAVISEEIVNGEMYVFMHFEPGETVVGSLYIPIDALIVYDYFLECTKYARMPWYLDFEKFLSIIDESTGIVGTPTGSSAQVIRVIYTLTCRDPNNPDIAFRYSKDLENPSVKPLVIGMNNPSQLLTGTFARYSGGYLSDNVIAGLLEGQSDVSQLEEILKGIPNE